MRILDFKFLYNYVLYDENVKNSYCLIIELIVGQINTNIICFTNLVMIINIEVKKLFTCQIVLKAYGFFLKHYLPKCINQIKNYKHLFRLLLS